MRPLYFLDIRKPAVRPLYTLAILALAWLAAGCSKPSAEEQASQAALSYYQQLVDGRADDVLSGRAEADSLPDDYRRQLSAAFSRYLDDIRSKHGGLAAVSLSANPARRDSIPTADGRWQHVVYTFLLLQFGDSTHEEITVPMVERDGEWHVR